MAYKLKKRYSNRNNYGAKRPTNDIKYICIHWTGNDGDSDEGNANYFATAIRNASAHAFVDDDSVTVSVPANYTAYSVGVDYQDQGSTYAKKGRKFAGKAYNSNTYNIEICDTKKDGKHQFSEKTIINAIAYTKKIMKKYHIDSNHVIRHFDVTGKICPLPFVVNEDKWKEFKANLECPLWIRTTTNGVKCRNVPSNKKGVYKLIGTLKKGKNVISIKSNLIIVYGGDIVKLLTIGFI